MIETDLNYASVALALAGVLALALAGTFALIVVGVELWRAVKKLVREQRRADREREP